MECNQGRSCPYLGCGDIFALLKERQYLRQRISEMEVVMSIIQTGILNKVEPLRLFLALTMRDISFLEEIIQIRGP